jgi:hypothetical protein
VQTGPRLALLPDLWIGSSIRPYALANAVALGGNSYLTSVGAGVSLGLPVAGALIEPFVETRQRRFESTPDYPLGNEQTGRVWTTGVLGQGPIWGSALRWQARAAYVRNDARRDYNAFEQLSLDIGFPIEFAGFWASPRPWVLIPTAGVSKAQQPNIIIDPFVRRRETEWRVGAAIDVPVHGAVGIGIQVQYASTDANIRNYETQNLSVVFGPTVRF